jgi:hypothetical protein
VDPAHDFRCSNDLSSVSLSMFGDVEEQPENIGRKLGTSYRSWFEEPVVWSRADELQSFIYFRLCGRDQLSGSRRWFARNALCCQKSKLFVSQLFPQGICQEPIDASRDMAQVEAEGRSTSGFAPDLGNAQSS